VDEHAIIFRSDSHSECGERAFMLGAVGIQSITGFDGEHHLLAVDQADAAAAIAHLDSYATELRTAALSPVADSRPPWQPYPHAWVGVLVYVFVLVGIALAVAQGTWHVDDFARGELNAALVQGGQWWRAWTALTLHRDIAHLVANLGGGAWFGYLAARQLGAGSAWALIVTGAAAANLVDAGFGPASYLSVGASTAVFAALGLMAAHSWRTRLHLSQRLAVRWAPLVAGVVLLGWFGTAGEGTDVVAHALGFAMGCLLGALAALPGIGQVLARMPQWLGGLFALGSLAVAWSCAARLGG
jgi:membrane associated rhomboid family serine protease